MLETRQQTAIFQILPNGIIRRLVCSEERAQYLKKEFLFKEKLERYRIRKEIEESFERMAMRFWDMGLLRTLRQHQKEFPNDPPKRNDS